MRRRRAAPGRGADRDAGTDFDRATWVAQLELGDLPSLAGVCREPDERDGRARILVRLRGVPIGFLDLPIPTRGLDREAVVRAAWEQLGPELRRHGISDGDAMPGSSEPSRDLQTTATARADHAKPRPLSVVVCTRDRASLVAASLANLKSLRYDRFEVVLVDSASTGEATWASFRGAVGDDPRFRYVREPLPGLSRARNRGLAEAAYNHVAFTDDDTIVDPLWLDGIDGGFARGADVGCVTGLVPSASLDTHAQRYFDRRVSWSARLAPRVFDLEARGGDTPLFPFDAGTFGTGANFSVDRRLALEIGGFDEALGAGTASRGGEDLDMFLRVLQGGRAIAYEPSAVVWHLHRPSPSALQRQVFDFGVGLGAYLTKHLGDHASRATMLRRAGAGMLHMGRLWQNGRRGAPTQWSLVAAECCGVALGPFALHRARSAVPDRGS